MTKPHETGTAKPPRDFLSQAIEVVKNAGIRGGYRDLAVTFLYVKAVQGAVLRHCATYKGPGTHVPASPETRDALVSVYHTTMTMYARTLQASAEQLVSAALAQGPVSAALSRGPGRELDARTTQIITDADHIADVAVMMLAIAYDDQPDGEVFGILSANFMWLHRFLAEKTKLKPTAKPTAN